MLLELALSTLAIGVLLLGFPVLEFWLLGGKLGSEPTAIDTTMLVSFRSGLEPAPLFVVGPATSSANVCLYCSLAGLTEATQGDPNAVFYPFEAVVPATPLTSCF